MRLRCICLTPLLYHLVILVMAERAVKNSSVMSRRSHRFLGIYQYYSKLKESCSGTLHGGVIGIEQMTSRSGVLYSTTTPQRYPYNTISESIIVYSTMVYVNFHFRCKIIVSNVAGYCLNSRRALCLIHSKLNNV